MSVGISLNLVFAFSNFLLYGVISFSDNINLYNVTIIAMMIALASIVAIVFNNVV